MLDLRTPRKQGAVILDMDGLMLDTEPLYQRAWERAAADLGYTLSAEFYYRALAGRRLDEYGQELLDTYGPTFPFGRFMELALIGWRELAEAEGAPPKQGLHELLRWLRTEGLSVAVATGNDRWRTELLLTRAALRDSMSHIATREDASAGKPAPDIFLAAARLLAHPPSQCVVVEDSNAGILAADRAGMRAIMVPDRQPPSEQARSLAHRVVGSLLEIPHVLRALLT